MTAIANLPDLRPSLLLDFANSGRVDPRVQLVRAGSAGRTNCAGVYGVLPSGVPRIDYDPLTGKCLGLLTEGGARTNLLANSVDLLLWAKGTGTVISSVSGGAPSGGASFAVVNSTASNHVSSSYQVVPGSTYVVSVYWRGTSKPVAGSLISAEYKNGDTPLRSVLNFSSSQVIADGKWRRYSVALTDSGTTSGARAVFFCTGTTGDGIDCGEIAMPQAELGTSHSSYIPTSGGAATRPAEMFSIDVPSLIGQVEGTALVEFSVDALKSVATSDILRIRDAANSQFISLREGAVIGGCDMVAYSSGTAAVDTASRPLSAGTLHKAALGYASRNTGFSLNGQPVLSNGTPTFPLPQPLSRLDFGAHMGHVQRIAIYNKRLTDAQLQRLTS